MDAGERRRANLETFAAERERDAAILERDEARRERDEARALSRFCVRSLLGLLSSLTDQLDSLEGEGAWLLTTTEDDDS